MTLPNPELLEDRQQFKKEKGEARYIQEARAHAQASVEGSGWSTTAVSDYLVDIVEVTRENWRKQKAKQRRQ